MITNFSSYALKVEDLDDAVAFYVKHFEARPCASGSVFGCNYASVNVADTMVYFFDKALYENAIGRVLPYGYLHAVFEVDDFAAGTIAVAQALEQATWESGAVSIIGGGDTAAAVAKAGAHKRMTHISTGGGASLECLGGRVLPGVEALDDGE